MTTRGDGRTMRDAWNALRFALIRTVVCVLVCMAGSGGMVALRSVSGMVWVSPARSVSSGLGVVSQKPFSSGTTAGCS